MNLTKSKLKQLIKEELQNILNEGIDDPIVNKFRAWWHGPKGGCPQRGPGIINTERAIQKFLIQNSQLEEGNLQIKAFCGSWDRKTNTWSVPIQIQIKIGMGE